MHTKGKAGEGGAWRQRSRGLNSGKTKGENLISERNGRHHLGAKTQV